MTSLAPTTRTVEMTQIAEINRRLAEPYRARITVADLPSEVASAPVRFPVPELPGSAVLVRLTWDGSPSFPNIHGHFRTGSTPRPAVVDLHTAALLAISHRLGLRHTWGVGPPGGGRGAERRR